MQMNLLIRIPSFAIKNVGELTNTLDTGIPTSGSINVDAFHGKIKYCSRSR